MRAGRVCCGLNCWQAIQPEERKILSFKNALPDFRLEPNRTGPVQQRRPHYRRSAGRSFGRNAEFAHQRAGRSHCLTNRFLGAHGPQHPNLSAAGNQHAPKLLIRGAVAYYIEKLTHELAHKAWELIQEVEELGGMAKAIETGLPKMRIEEAAARKQARIDSGKDVIVGVNKYQLESEDHNIEILDIDNTAVRNSQLERLAKLKAERNQADVEKALNNLTEAAKNNTGNLLALAVEAARVRATLGEISDALEKIYGRHKAVIRSISGVYAAELSDDDNFGQARLMADKFAELEGRRPRIMVAKWARTDTTAAPKLLPLPSPTWALT